MNVTRTAVVALIAFSGVAIPATGAAHADGDQPLLCGLLDPCDATAGSGDDEASEPESAPVDVDIDIDLDLDLDTDVAVDAAADVDLQLLPSKGTSLTTSADTALDTDATVGHGVVLTANGAANKQAAVSAAGHELVSADAANTLCGVQVVIAAASSADCRSTGSSSGSQAGAGDSLVAVVESIDLCGAHVVVAGSAATKCGGSSANGSPAMGSSWTLADAGITGSLCGLSVAVAGASNTSCPGAAQEAPVPGAGTDGPGTGTPGTGTNPTNAGTSGNTGVDANGGVGGVGSSPTAQPQQAGGGDAAGDSSGSLPLTGTSMLIVLMIASVSLAAGLVAVRSSRVRFGHQS